MAKVVENYYEKLEKNIRAITKKFRKEMMEDFQKLRETWSSEREEAAAAKVAANRKREKDKVVGEGKKKKKRRVKVTVVEKKKKKLKKKGKRRRERDMEVRKRKRLKKTKENKNTKNKRKNYLRKDEEGDWQSRRRRKWREYLQHQLINRARGWPDGRARLLLAAWRMRSERTDHRRVGKLLRGRFRGGGGVSGLKKSRRRDETQGLGFGEGLTIVGEGGGIFRWTMVEIRREKTELGFGRTGERILGRKKENEEEDGPFCVDEGWGARKMEVRQKADMGGGRGRCAVRKREHEGVGEWWIWVIRVGYMGIRKLEEGEGSRDAGMDLGCPKIKKKKEEKMEKQKGGGPFFGERSMGKREIIQLSGEKHGPCGDVFVGVSPLFSPF